MRRARRLRQQGGGKERQQAITPKDNTCPTDGRWREGTPSHKVLAGDARLAYQVLLPKKPNSKCGCWATRIGRDGKINSLILRLRGGFSPGCFSKPLVPAGTANLGKGVAHLRRGADVRGLGEPQAAAIWVAAAGGTIVGRLVS